MSDFIRSFHRVLTLSLYGFSLVFVFFVVEVQSAVYVESTDPYAEAIAHFNANQSGDPSYSIETGMNGSFFYCTHDTRTTRSTSVQVSPNVVYTRVSDQTNTTARSPDVCFSPADNSGNYGFTESFTGSCPMAFPRNYCDGNYPNEINHFSDPVIYYFAGSPYVDSDTGEQCSSGGTLNSINSFSCDLSECAAGDYGDCRVECGATAYAPAGFTGYGQTCGAVTGSDVSFSDNPIADYACVGSSGLLKCDTGLNNGQTGSGSGGSHTVDDTFFEYCKTNMNDYECQQSFAGAEIPTCQSGAAFDAVLGCDYPVDQTVICPSGSQINSNSACVPKVVSNVPIVSPDPQFVGGTIQGGGNYGDNDDDTDGDPSLDSEGIIDAVEDVEQSVDEGNAIAQAILDEMLDDLTSGGGTCDSAPSCSGDAIQCQIVQQTWLLRCDTPDSEYSALCTSPFLCSGDSFSCARDEFYYDLACATNPLTQGQALSDEAITATGAALGNLANTLGMDLETMGENAARREQEGYQSFESIDVEQIVADADLANSVAGSCPADISFTVLGGQEFVIPISDYCDILFYIGVLIRLSAAFVGLRIIFTGLMRV